MIRATPDHAPAITAFLNRHAERAMFPLANLANHGMSGGHPYAVTFWYSEADGQITDALTLSDSGMAMPFLPSGDYAGAATSLVGQNLTGMIGPRDCVRGLQDATGLTHAPATFSDDEPHFALNLTNLQIPDGPGVLHPLDSAPKSLILKWIADYDIEALNTPADQATFAAQATYDQRLATDSHRVLMDGDQVLAKTGINAALPDIVQIGGVYTPPALRGQGHARRAVALHLAEARKNGATRATLFSASDMAARAYQAIGFHRIGDWTLLLFDGPQAAHV